MTSIGCILLMAGAFVFAAVPQDPPASNERDDEPRAEIRAVVTDVDLNDDGSGRLIVQSLGKSFGSTHEIVVRISRSTVVRTRDTEARLPSDLKPGKQIVIGFSGTLQPSVPPRISADSITLLPDVRMDKGVE